MCGKKPRRTIYNVRMCLQFQKREKKKINLAQNKHIYSRNCECDNYVIYF